MTGLAATVHNLVDADDGALVLSGVMEGQSMSLLRIT